jgi:hypothetical protein
VSTVAKDQTHSTAALRLRDCSSAGNTTRSLLGYLVVAGPFYVAVSLVQAYPQWVQSGPG